VRPRLATVAVGGVALAAAAVASGGISQPPYTRAATQSCLTALPNSITGLPPATPPVPPALFVDALSRDDLSTGGIGPRPRAHAQLGAWYGDRNYEGIILSFFGSSPDARASLKTLASLYGGKLIRNVVVTWDQKRAPSPSVEKTVLGCLRSVAAGGSTHPPPPATLATFAGNWGGHTRGLTITPAGHAREFADDGCCTHVYQMTFQILSVSGTLTRGSAEYRVTSFHRYESGVRSLHAGDVGKVVLRNGIATNTLTHDFFCSDPAWGATGACGA
jgi:hypothetical protein